MRPSSSSSAHVSALHPSSSASCSRRCRHERPPGLWASRPQGASADSFPGHRFCGRPPRRARPVSLLAFFHGDRCQERQSSGDECPGSGSPCAPVPRAAGSGVTPGAVAEEGKRSDGTAVARYRFLTEHAFSSPFEIRYICSSDCGPWARAAAAAPGSRCLDLTPDGSEPLGVWSRNWCLYRLPRLLLLTPKSEGHCDRPHAHPRWPGSAFQGVPEGCSSTGTVPSPEISEPNTSVL